MLTAFVRAFQTPDLRKKMLITLGLVALFRFGASLPTPGIDEKNVTICSNAATAAGSPTAGVLGIVNLLSGQALLHLSVFALGIMPYITASIILQLLTVVIPRLETLKQEGQAGQAKITQYTRYLTVGLAILQSTGYVELARSGTLFNGCGVAGDNPIIPNGSVFTIATMVITMVAGTTVIMWMGELITDRGVGNGMSVMIFTTVISVIPGELLAIYRDKSPFYAAVAVVVVVFIVAFIVFMEQAQRRIPVQYAKRMVGRRMYGGTSTYIPMKVNQAGVIPVIFASSLLYIPTLGAQLFGKNSTSGWVAWARVLRTDHRVYVLLRVDHLQSGRSVRQHEEVRRLHSRHPARSSDRRVPQVRAQQADRARVGLPGRDCTVPAGGAVRHRGRQRVPVQRSQPADHGRRRA
jgi:preprotein translocase subunit SecY